MNNPEQIAFPEIGHPEFKPVWHDISPSLALGLYSDCLYIKEDASVKITYSELEKIVELVKERK